MVAETAREHYYFGVLAIIAIVSITGLVVMFSGYSPAYSSSVDSVEGVISSDDSSNIGGEATRFGKLGVVSELGDSNEKCDRDGDGFFFEKCIDCDDKNVNVNPGMTEVCNGMDDDCDGSLMTNEYDYSTGVEICNGLDDDCDGSLMANEYGFSIGVEVCDGFDNDCDGEVDEGFNSVCSLKITDLENIDVSNFSSDVGCFRAKSYSFCKHADCTRYNAFGHLFGTSSSDEPNSYTDYEEYDTPQMVLFKISVGPASQCGNPPVNISSGEYVTMTYNGGQQLNVYLPQFYGTELVLYVGNDGSTFYDEDLTDVAYALDSVENECVRLEHAATGNLNGWLPAYTNIGGCAYNDQDCLCDVEWNTDMSPHPGSTHSYRACCDSDCNEFYYLWVPSIAIDDCPSDSSCIPDANDIIPSSPDGWNYNEDNYPNGVDVSGTSLC